jgi:2-polyprenyl-3-methyl-5-hydroxy-6-metoxy-1,4-benzoquinol methylase
MITTRCPLCGNDKLTEWKTFDCRRNNDYNPGFPPIKTWLLCEPCHHLVAKFVPDDIGKILNDNPDKQYEKPNIQRATHIFPDTIERVAHFRPPLSYGTRLLDVGCGGGELSLVAEEYGYSVTAIDIREDYVKSARRLGINAHVASVKDFDTGSYDVICAGDVLEHLANPIELFNLFSRVLSPSGVVWLSTPNWDGAISTMLGNEDAMKSVAEHINYFSRRSLSALIMREGYEILDYRASRHYFGCMEVIFQ